MLNIRYIFRLIGAFFSRFRILIFAGIGLGVLVFFLLGFLLPSIDSTKKLRIGETGRYSISNLPSDILSLIGNGLTKIDSDGSVIPDLASSWETTDKGKTWYFTLKDNIYWQNGDKVKSKEIVYQFSDVSIEYIDDKTIVFKLQNAYSAFPAVVSKPVFKSGLLGTGDWKVSKISLNGSIVEEISLESKDKVKIVYKFYPTEERTKVAFQLGQVDQIRGLFNPSPFNDWKRIKIDKQVNYGEFVAVFFNTQDPILTNKSLRQALSYAVDKNILGENRALGPISKTSWAYNPQVKPYSYDLKKAKEIVSDYKSENKIEDLTINLTTSSVLLDISEIIKRNWEEIGVKVNIQVLSVIPTEYQAFLAIYDSPDDPDQYSMWHSTQTSTNITHYVDPRIDKLLEDGRSEVDLESRKKIYLDFQRFLVEDSPAAFLYYPSTYTISR